MTQSFSENTPQLDYLSHETGFGGLPPRQVVRPLWFILVGGVLCCITLGITFNSHGQNNWTLHLTGRPVGAILVTIGVWRLGRVDIDREYTLLMRFIFVVAFFQIAATIADYFPPSIDPLILLVRIFINLASIVALVAFCACMRWFCLDTGLRRSARGWLKTTVVFCFSSVPLALSQSMMLMIVLGISRTQPSEVIQASWWYLLLVPLIVGPPLAFLLSILQMGREMRRREFR